MPPVAGHAVLDFCTAGPFCLGHSIRTIPLGASPRCTCGPASIYELEILPVLLAMRAWGKLFAHEQIVACIDNEAAKTALIKSSAATSVGERLVSAVGLAEDQLQLRCWYSRVPSVSNPADAPAAAWILGHA